MKRIVSISWILTIGLLAAGAAGPKVTTPVKTQIHDSDPDTEIIYNIRSDSGGTYFNGVDSVVSIINLDGDYAFNLKNSIMRRMYIGYDDPAPSDQINQPPSSGLAAAQFQARCSQYGVNIRSLPLGGSATCGYFVVSIDYAGVTYSLRSGDPYPGTDRVQLTCTGVNAGKCSSWEMMPSTVYESGSGPTRKMKMQLIRPGRRQSLDEKLGIYFMSFKVSITP